jgi:hypothetical protein
VCASGERAGKVCVCVCVSDEAAGKVCVCVCVSGEEIWFKAPVMCVGTKGEKGRGWGVIRGNIREEGGVC